MKDIGGMRGLAVAAASRLRRQVESCANCLAVQGLALAISSIANEKTTGGPPAGGPPTLGLVWVVKGSSANRTSPPGAVTFAAADQLAVAVNAITD